MVFGGDRDFDGPIALASGQLRAIDRNSRVATCRHAIRQRIAFGIREACTAEGSVDRNGLTGLHQDWSGRIRYAGCSIRIDRNGEPVKLWPGATRICCLDGDEDRRERLRRARDTSAGHGYPGWGIHQHWTGRTTDDDLVSHRITLCILECPSTLRGVVIEGVKLHDLSIAVG